MAGRRPVGDRRERERSGASGGRILTKGAERGTSRDIAYRRREEGGLMSWSK